MRSINRLWRQSCNNLHCAYRWGDRPRIQILVLHFSSVLPTDGVMEINQNPPSEREWTIPEREEFFAGQDARTTSIHVTHITPPEQGWPIDLYCPLCEETTFLLSPWANKPEEGVYWWMNGTCARDGVCIQHNIKLAIHKPTGVWTGLDRKT